LSKLSTEELIDLQLHKNDWYVRTARRLLQERVAAGQKLDIKQTHFLRVMFQPKLTFGNKPPVGQLDTAKRLRALWAIYSTGVPNFYLYKYLGDKDEHIRAWIVRLLVDDAKSIAVENKANANTLKKFVQMAATDPSSLVRLYLASALQRLPVAKRGALAEALLQHEEDANDHNMPLMIWYGIEPLVASDAKKAVTLAASSKIPKVRQFIARRLTEELAKKPGPVGELVQLALASSSTAFQLDILRGMNQALQGWYKAAPPTGWQKLQDKLDKTGDKELAKLVQNLSVVFGDGRAIGELNQLVLNSDADANARRAALQVLIDSKTPDLLPLLKKLVGDRATVALAVKGLAAYDDAQIPALILQHYHFLNRDGRDLAIGTLVSRPAFAEQLLKAVAEKHIEPADISAYHARQIVSFGKESLHKQLTKLWGDVRTTPAEKKQQIEQYKKLLTAAALKTADLPKGRLMFQQHCASCHKLFGEGSVIGPDLTGGQRDNLDYLLENIIDPSAVVPAPFRMSIVSMKDGRVFNGLVVSQTDQVLTLQTQKDQLKLARKDVDTIVTTTLSLMPDGLFNNLKQEQIVNLIAYLMSPAQVQLPKQESKK
jgi:putative heme-binding domain-containing protein